MHHRLAGMKSEIEHQFEVFEIRTVGNSELTAIQIAMSELRKFDAGQALYEMCQDNFEEIIQFVDAIEPSIEARTFDRTRALRQANRRVMNFLSSFRSFVDHWEKKLNHLEDQHGIDLLPDFKKITAYHYDSYFAYRFLSQLRNYAQHYAMPIQDFRIITSQNNPKREVFLEPVMHFCSRAW